METLSANIKSSVLVEMERVDSDPTAVLILDLKHQKWFDLLCLNLVGLHRIEETGPCQINQVLSKWRYNMSG